VHAHASAAGSAAIAGDAGSTTADAGDANSTAGDAGDAAPGTDHVCSACAACCMGLALMPQRSALPASEPISLPHAATEAPVVSFISGGLERPPRSPLA
jgi:hypothetical protein